VNDRPDPLADNISLQAAGLWGHLPEELIPDEDAPLRFKVDDQGALLVMTSDSIFRYADGATWRVDRVRWRRHRRGLQRRQVFGSDRSPKQHLELIKPSKPSGFFP
jgi:hypothetical protein